MLTALLEAARADKQTADRFVPQRPNILEEASTRRHQFIFGRRGVGKSTLLRKIESDAPGSKVDVMFVDIETLRGRPYPDVLIELLIAILDGLAERLDETGPRIDLRRRRRRAKRSLRELSRVLCGLRDEPQTAQRIIRQRVVHHRSTGIKVGFAGIIGKLQAVFHIGAGRTSRRVESREAAGEASKMDGLQSAVVLIRSALEDAQAHLGGRDTLLVLDDFYHIPSDAQPAVLAYLHQIVKNLGIFLKVCSVKHRTRPYAEGDPPCGLQPRQDAGEVSLDITLERFHDARRFLEKVLMGLCEPLGIGVGDLITDRGCRRLILGSGGVARDYLDITHDALKIANERDVNREQPRNRIDAEDVDEAAGVIFEQKQGDLGLDASSDRSQLRDRLTDLVRFCLDARKTNVFTVDGQHLREEDWGEEIQALADLRLLHQICNFSERPEGSRARRFLGFTLDLGNNVDPRWEGIEQVEFWTPQGKEVIREAIRSKKWVYTPGAARHELSIKHQAARDPLATREARAEWESEQASAVPPSTG